jgi:hypothetical protein
MTAAEKFLAEVKWFADDGPGPYTDEAYRAMPGHIRRLVAMVEAALAALDQWERNPTLYGTTRVARAELDRIAAGGEG